MSVKLSGLVYIFTDKQVLWRRFRGLKGFESINILTKERNANLDMFLYFTKEMHKNSFDSNGCISY